MIKTLAAFGALFTLLGGAAVEAQDAAFGAEIYKDHCVVCHGETGAGDGTVGKLFAQPPADLRLLSRNNSGTFPTDQVIEAIYGRRPIQAHGQTEMPIWGDYFMTEALESRSIDPKDAAMVTQGRVLSVVSHLESLQVE
jgi:mono/diheme cytochrome c family protein